MDPSALDQVLEGMNAQGQFAASVLASDDGLPVAFAPSPCPYDANTVAAIVSLVRGFMQEAQQQLGLADVEEVSTVVSDRTRLICRYFGMGDKRFVLAIVAQPNQSHRRLSTRAIRELQEVWDD